MCGGTRKGRIGRCLDGRGQNGPRSRLLDAVRRAAAAGLAVCCWQGFLGSAGPLLSRYSHRHWLQVSRLWWWLGTPAATKQLAISVAPSGGHVTVCMHSANAPAGPASGSCPAIPFSQADQVCTGQLTTDLTPHAWQLLRPEVHRVPPARPDRPNRPLAGHVSLARWSSRAKPNVAAPPTLQLGWPPLPGPCVIRALALRYLATSAKHCVSGVYRLRGKLLVLQRRMHHKRNTNDDRRDDDNLVCFCQSCSLAMD